MKLMKDAELGSTGAALMSRFHQLSDGNNGEGSVPPWTGAAANAAIHSASAAIPIAAEHSHGRSCTGTTRRLCFVLSDLCIFLDSLLAVDSDIDPDPNAPPYFQCVAMYSSVSGKPPCIIR